jgi:hypothetical protein
MKMRLKKVLLVYEKLSKRLDKKGKNKVNKWKRTAKKYNRVSGARK